jgi:hypothetical protein
MTESVQLNKILAVSLKVLVAKRNSLAVNRQSENKSEFESDRIDKSSAWEAVKIEPESVKLKNLHC